MPSCPENIQYSRASALTDHNAAALQSFLLNRIIQYLHSVYGEDFTTAVGITAATGIAATHIGGKPSPTMCCLMLAHLASAAQCCIFGLLSKHQCAAVLPGTTLHAQAGCGIINMWNDFGRMWKKPAIEKWQAIKVGQLTLSGLCTKSVWRIGKFLP